jgi:catechol-2,3-dioxygenase
LQTFVNIGFITLVIMDKKTNTNDPTTYAAKFVVTSIEKQVTFYTENIGLKLQWKDDRQAGLGGCQSNVLLLTTVPASEKSSSVNIELPDRRELAKVVGRLCTIKYPNKPLDYGDKHVALITDPEGNTVSVTVKIPGASPHEPTPLDIESLFNQLDPDDRLCDQMSEKARVNQQSS